MKLVRLKEGAISIMTMYYKIETKMTNVGGASYFYCS